MRIEAQAHGTGSEQELLMLVVTATATYRTPTTVIAADAAISRTPTSARRAEQQIDACIPDNG